jgi:Phosphatidate cytidylyltransferase, mitochondrial
MIRPSPLRLLRPYATKRPPPSPFPEYNKATYGAEITRFSQLPTDFGANQHMSIDILLKEQLRLLLWKFNAPIRYAFAYGSGVFPQRGQQKVLSHVGDRGG